MKIILKIIKNKKIFSGVLITLFLITLSFPINNAVKQFREKKKINDHLSSLISNDSLYVNKEQILGASTDNKIYTVFKTTDGDYALMQIVTAKLKEGNFDGEIVVRFPNGDLYSTDSSAYVPELILRDHTKTEGQKVENAITFFNLKGGGYVAVQIINANIVDGRMDGVFSALQTNNGYQMAGSILQNKIESGYIVDYPTYVIRSTRLFGNLMLLEEQKLSENDTQVLGLSSSDLDQQNSNNKQVMGVMYTKNISTYEGTLISPNYGEGTYTITGLNEESEVSPDVIASLIDNSIKNYDFKKLITQINASAVANKLITSEDISDLTIQAIDIANGAITGSKVKDDSLGGIDIIDGSLENSDLADNSINSDKVDNNTITTSDLSNTLTFGDGDFLDLGAIVHDDSAPQGLRLPNVSSSTPVGPSTGEGYLAYDSAGNQVIVFDGSSWITIGGSISLYNGTGTSATTSSSSGMELINTDELSLIRGCNNGELLKWNSGTNIWECSVDAGGSGSGIAVVQENDTTIVASGATLDFLGSDFTVSESPSGEANVSIDYSNSHITRDNQTQSISGAWTYSNGLTVSSGTVSLPAAQIDNSELANSSLTVTAGTGLSGGGAVSLGGSVSLVATLGTSIANSELDNDTIDFDKISDSLTLDAATSITAASTLNYSIGNNVNLVASGTGTIVATDLSCTDCITGTEIGTLTLGSDTDGNYVATITAGNGLGSTGATSGETVDHTLSVNTGNGIQVASDNVALGPLNANWDQTGAFDLVLNNSGSELVILESDGGSSTGTLDVGSLSGSAIYTFVGASGNVLTSANAASQLSAWDQDSSDDLTTSNYSSTLDSVYVNVAESPTAGDISGSFSAGLTINSNSVALSTDTTGNYVANITSGNGGISIGSSAGEGWTPTISLVVAPSADGLSSSTSSGSGLEVLASGVALLQGCSNNEILKWNESTDLWGCAADATGGGAGNSFETITTPAGTSPVADSSTDTLTLSNGSGISITGDSTTDAITIAATLGTSIANAELDNDTIDFDKISDSLTLDAATTITAASTLNFTIGNNVNLVASGTGTIVATDLSCTDCISGTEIGTLTLGTDTDGNYVATITAGNGLDSTGATTGETIAHTLSVNTGNGIQISSDAVALGPLTGNWNQTGAFDIVLNNSGSELIILESDGGTSTGIIDVGSLSGDATYTFIGSSGNVLTSANAATQLSAWDQDSSDDLTTGNYTATLDSVYVNVAESPTSADISGSFSAGLTINSNSVALGTDTTGNYVGNVSSANGAISITGSAGENWTPSVTFVVAPSADALSANTSSGSGLEILSSGVAMLQGCSDGQILKWNESTDLWACASDNNTGSNYWSAAAGVLSPNGTDGSVIAATSAATTVATFTATGSNNALAAGSTGNYLTISSSGNLNTAGSITGGAGSLSSLNVNSGGITNSGAVSGVTTLSASGDIAGGSITTGGDTINDFTGTGLSVTGNVLSTTLGVSIANAELDNDTIDFDKVSDSLTLDANTSITASGSTNLTIGNNVNLIASGTGTIVATDLSCTDCIGPTEISVLTLSTDTNGNYVADVTAGNAAITIGSSAGEGWTPTVSLTLLASADALSSTTSNGSGLEIISGQGVGLLQGCNDGQILKWNETTDAWTCNSDATGGGAGDSFTTIDTPAGTDPTADSSTDTLQYLVSGTNLTITGANDPETVTFNLDESVLAGAGLAANGSALDVNTGNGIQITSDALALGALSGNWNQTGAFDIVLNNAGSELVILESDGGTSIGTIDVGSLSGDAVYTFVGATGNVITSTNAATQLSAWDQNASDDVTTFLGLSDTPSSYSGQGLKVVRVNTGATGLEFVDPATLGTNYFQRLAGNLSPATLNDTLSATSSAGTVATFTSTGSNNSFAAGSSGNYLTISSSGALTTSANVSAGSFTTGGDTINDFTGTGLSVTGNVLNVSNVPNASLQNSSISLASQSGSGSVALGGTLTINGGGIATSSLSGSTYTVTATEADTLSSVTGRGATTSTAITLSNTSPLVFSGVNPTITANNGNLTFDLSKASTNTFTITNSDGSNVANLSVEGVITGSNISGTNTGDQTITLTGDVTGSGTGSFATTIAADAVALGIDTTGNYVAGATANGGLTLTGTEGATLGILVQANKGLEVDSNGISLIDCGDTQILKYSTGTSQWSCQADATGSNYWQRNSTTLAQATLGDNLLVSDTATTSEFQFDVNGKQTGKALVAFNETGDQNIVTASASGTTVFNLTRQGDITSGFTQLNGSSTANGAGTNSKSVILTSGANFDVGNYIQVSSTSCESGVNTCYAKVTAKATNTLTVDHSLSWANGSSITEYHIPEVGGTDITSTQTERYGRGYFFSGVVTGSGSTTYTDQAIFTSDQVGTNSAGFTISTGNTTSSGNSGNITIDTGTAAGTAGIINIGGSNASSVTIGRSGVPVSVSGNLDLANNLILNIGDSGTDFTSGGGLTLAGTLSGNGQFTLGDNGDTGAINTSDWDISASGDLTGIGAITADGAITFSNLTANRLVSTTTGGALTTSLSSANAALSITDETGGSGGLLVFNNAPSITSPTITGSPTAAGATWTDLGIATTIDINGGTIDGTAIGNSARSTGAFTTLAANSTVTLSGISGGVSVNGLCLDVSNNVITCSAATNYWQRVAGNLSSATLNDTLSATSSAGTVATFTSTGSNNALSAGSTGNYLTISSAGNLNTAGTITGGAGSLSALNVNNGGVTNAGSVSGVTTLSASGDISAGSFTTGGDTINDFTGTGLSVTGNVLSTTLGTSISNSELVDDTIDFDKISDSLTLDAATSITAGGSTNLTIGNNVNLVASGTGTIIATDLNCTNCIGGTEITDLTLGTDTAGNYVATVTAGAGLASTGASTGETIDHSLSVNTGNGTQIVSDAVVLGPLTSNWDQTGAFDISLNNSASEIQILESTGATFFGKLDVGDLGADATYTFSGTSGTVLTDANYTTSLDSIYVNVGESPAAGDISGSFTAGLTITANSVALTTDTTGNYVANVTAGNGGVSIGSSAGEGWTPTISLVVAPSADALSANTSSGSGLEVLSSGVALLQGCANNEILKWNESSDIWACSADTDTNTDNWTRTAQGVLSPTTTGDVLAATSGATTVATFTQTSGTNTLALKAGGTTNFMTVDIDGDIVTPGSISGAAGTFSGTVAANGASGISSSQSTLIINAGGNLDVQDTINADAITSDAGVSIAAGNSYTGAGAVTLSSGGSAILTLDSASGTVTIASGDAIGNGTWSISSAGAASGLTGTNTGFTAGDLSCTNCIGPTEISDLTLGTDTAGNYVSTVTAGAGLASTGATTGETIDHSLSVNTGNGTQIVSDAVVLGPLTGNWDQTGAFDISLNNAASEIQILESTGATFFGKLDVGDLGADATYTFSGTSGTVLTDANYTTSLDSIYVNVGESPTGGDISGSFSGGLTLNSNTVDDAELVDSLTYTGALSVGNLTISDTSVPLTGASFTFDFNNGSDRTFTIANSGAGTANLSVDGTITGSNFSGSVSGTNTGDQNIFRTFDTTNGTDPVADTTTDTLIIADGTGITVTGDSTADSITIAATLGTAIDTSEITDGTITGDDINSNIAGSGLALTAGSPDTLDINTGNGIQITSDAVALGALSANWNQTGAFDISLNNAASEIQILESTGATYFGKLDVGDLGADATYTFSGTSGTVLTDANYATSLDSIYVNVGESPTAGDISGSFTAGLTIAANSVALTTDTTGNYVANVTAGNGGVSIGSSAGEGWTPTVSVIVAPSADALSSTTSSGSGLEVLSSGIALLQGCANNEVLKWNESSDIWACAADTDTNTDNWTRTAQGLLSPTTSNDVVAATSSGTTVATFTTTGSANALAFQAGGVSNFVTIDKEGDLVAAGDLTVSGGDITLGTTSIFSGGDTASLNNIDAIDATTESTIESAIDTLANLTSASSLATVGTLTGGATGTGFTISFTNSTLSGNVTGSNISGVDISDDTNLTAGTNITLTGDDLSVDDAFILNSGDSGTGVYDFGGATSFEVPNGAAPTVNVFGQIAADNDFWGAGRGAYTGYDGTSQVVFPGILASDTCGNGQIPKFNTGGTWTCEDDNAGAGSQTLQQTYVQGATIDVTTGEGALAVDLQSANFDIEVGQGTDTGDFRIWDGTDNWVFVDESADTLSLGAAAGSGITLGGTGITTTNPGALTVTQTLTANGALDSNGDVTIADTDITFDGATTTFTTSGDLTIDSGGSNILLADALNAGGATAQAYNFFAASGTAGHTAAGEVTNTSDVFVADDLEVDGTIFADGGITGTLTGSATDLNCTDCINATEIADVYLLNTGDTATGSYTFTLGAAELLTVDGATTDSATTGGVFDLNVDSVTNNNIGLNVDYTLRDSAGITAYGEKLNYTIDTDAGESSTGYGLYINGVNNDATSTLTGLYVDAGSGAGTEYAAAFLNGNVGFGVSAPTSLIDARNTINGTVASTLNVETTGTSTTDAQFAAVFSMDAAPGSSSAKHYDGISTYASSSSNNLTTNSVINGLYTGSEYNGNGTVTELYGLYADPGSTYGGSGTITTSYGIGVGPAADDNGGTIQTTYGIHVGSQTAGSIADYGVAIGPADTTTLWISDTANSTTAAGGIAFGSSKDTNLFRSATNALATDDNFYIDLALSAGDTTPDGNAYNTLGTGDAGHVAAGEVTDGSDLFITDDLEVDGTIFADGGITGTLTGSATDLNCTDCINATEIADVYLLNTGDTSTGSYTFGLGAAELITIDGTTTDNTGTTGILDINLDSTSSQQAINIDSEIIDDNAIDTQTGLTITMTNSGNDSDVIYGLHVANLGGSASGGNEYGIYQAGTSWDYGIYAEDLVGIDNDLQFIGAQAITTSTGDLTINSGGTLQISDASIFAGSAEGTAAVTLTAGDLVLTDGDITLTSGQFEIPDNTANAFTLEDATGGLDYLNITTTDGSETMVLGHSTVDSITFTTDGTGSGEIVLPNDSIGADEIWSTGQADGECLKWATGDVLSWDTCGGSSSLDIAYNGGGSITVDAYDILFDLNDGTNDYGLVIDNNTASTIDIGLEFTTGGGGALTTAIDVSASAIGNALSLGTNQILSSGSFTIDLNNSSDDILTITNSNATAGVDAAIAVDPGTAGNPGFTFVGDTNTGIYRLAAEKVAFVGNGQPGLYFSGATGTGQTYVSASELTDANYGKFNVVGKITGKALTMFDETGDQDILTASASGTTRMRLTNTGTLVLGSIYNAPDYSPFKIISNGPVLINGATDGIYISADAEPSISALYEASGDGLISGFNFSNSTFTFGNGNITSNSSSKVSFGADAIGYFQPSGNAGGLWYVDPSTSNPGTCTQGQLVSDGTNLYYCEATNTWVDLTVQGGGGALDTLTAATTDDTALLNADNTIIWDWALNSANSKGITLGESTAGTNGVGNQHVLEISTLSTSTAGPLEITSNSADGGDIEFNLASAGDFEIQDNGTAFVTFTDAGLTTFASDVDYSLAATENLTVTNTTLTSADLISITGTTDTTTTSGTDAVQIAFTQSDDADATDTNAAMQINVTSSSGDADTLYGININTLTPGTAAETALNLGSGWDKGLVIADAGTASVTLSSTDGDGASGITFGSSTPVYAYRSASGELSITDNTTAGSGNYFQFDTVNGPTYGGTARPTKQIALSPEYAGGVLSAFYGDATDTNVTGTMTSDADSSGNLFRTYYQWSRTQSTQHWQTVAVRVTLPQDFSAWTTSNALQIDYKTGSATESNSEVEVHVYNSSNATEVTHVITGTASTSWATQTIDDSVLDAGNAQDLDAAGETAIIYLRMGSQSSNAAQVGDIKLNYLAKF